MKKPLLFLLLPLLSISLQAQIQGFEFYIQQEKDDTIITLVSTETFPCLGYGIRAYKVWSNDTLIIDIRGFKRPNPCDASMDVAREKLEMSGIGTKFSHIKFRWEEYKDKKYEDKWQIEIKGDTYKITPLISTFSRYVK